MSSHLRSVDGPTDAFDDDPPATGMFEGQPVHFARMKLSSASDLETTEDVLHIDETVQLYVMGRVIRVDHAVDAKTGYLKRLHTVQIVEAISLPANFNTGVFDD